METGIFGRAGQNQIGMSNQKGRALLFFQTLLVGCLTFFLSMSLVFSIPSGFVAQYSININGNGCVFDSFDSSDPAHSIWQTNQEYNGQHFGTYTNTLRKDNAVVATDGSLMNVSSAKIYGHVDVGPGGSVSIGPTASIGDINWIGPDPNHPLHTGIQPGRFRNDMVESFPDVTVPSPSTWLSVPTPTSNTIIVGGQTYTNNAKLGQPGSYTIGGIPYSLIITNRADRPGTTTNKVYYQYPSLLKQSIFIDASNVVLYLPNGVSFGPGDNLTLNTNSNVEIYLGSAMDTGNAFINNPSQYASALRLFGLSGCTYITFGQNAELAMLVYAPKASVAYNGGANIYDVIGAVTAHDISVYGSGHFHSDEFLSSGLPFPPLITSHPGNKAVPVGSAVSFNAVADGGSPEIYSWFFNQTNLLSCGTNNTSLSLTNVQPSDAGLYSVIITNSAASVTSAPALLFIYTNETQLAAQMSYPSTSSPGQFRFNITGATGLNYIIQTSTNLIDWVSLETKTAPFIFTDTNIAASQQFYRAIYSETAQ